MVRIDWRYIKERGDYKEDNSKNRGFSLVEVDTRYDIKTVLESFYEDMKEPVQIINIRQERI
jgi:hypothetical protein|tara:strand:+ start:511 stop:696 length:186 start_codon:yes stop_codon:yes gene_type:complete